MLCSYSGRNNDLSLIDSACKLPGLLLCIPPFVESLRSRSESLHAKSRRFCAIIAVCHLLEPFVLQGLMSRDALTWIIDENLSQKILEVPHKWRRGGYHIVKIPHRLHESTGASGCFGVRVVQLQAFKVSCSAVSAVPAGTLVDLLYQVRIDFASYNCFHHGKMLQIVVCLEQGVSCVELD